MSKIGLLAIVAWTGLTCFIIFYSLAKVKLLRVDTEKEFRGKNQCQMKAKLQLQAINGITTIIFRNNELKLKRRLS